MGSYRFESEVKDPDSWQYNSSLYDDALRAEEVRAFELTSLEPATRLEMIEKEVKLRVKITKNEIFKIGELLCLAKNICKQEGTKFQEWILERFDFSYETAHNFMNVYIHCYGLRTVAMSVKASILYKIAAPSFPEELREYLFTQGRLDKLTNKAFGKITAKYKEGGLEAIEEEVAELNRASLACRQTCYTLDMVENCLRTLEALKQKIEARGRNDGCAGMIEFAEQIKSDEPVAAKINSLLWNAFNTATETIEKAMKESEDILESFKDGLQERWGSPIEEPPAVEPPSLQVA